MTRLQLIAGIFLIGTVTQVALGQGTEKRRTVLDGVFTAAQANRGKEAYATHCSSCHSEDLTGLSAPALQGEQFMDNWREDSAKTLFTFMQTRMPQRAPGSLKQDMYVEINPADAAERGVTNGGWVWVTGAENNSKARMKALVTERVGKGVAWMPFHFAGWFQGVDQRSKYPKGNDPIVLGESMNTLSTYGFDPVTGMQEPKATLCQIRTA